jgi:AbrB family looped-hinge helix DNA binding protein
VLVTKVGRKGQITVPKEIRQCLRIEEGDRIAFVRRGEEIILQPLTRTLLDLRGSVTVSTPQDFDAIRRKVLAEHAKKVARDDA